VIVNDRGDGKNGYGREGGDSEKVGGWEGEVHCSLCTVGIVIMSPNEKGSSK
jgi:hypothetical protein